MRKKSFEKKPPEKSSRRIISWMLAGGLFLCIAVYVVIPALLTYLSLHPSRVALESNALAGYDLNYEDVNLTTADGLNLSGWYIPSQNGAAVIALHEYGGNRTGVLPHAALLAKHGYGVLLFDFRAHGESQGDTFPLGWDVDRDIRAALDYVEQRPDVDPDRIGVLGVSAGAEGGIQAAAGDTRIKALVAEGASYRTVADVTAITDTATLVQVPGVWVMVNSARLLSGTQPPAATKDLAAKIAPRALFLISASVPEEQMPNRNYYQAAGEPKFMWEPPDAERITALEAYPEEYEIKIVGFFDQFLLQARL